MEKRRVCRTLSRVCVNRKMGVTPACSHAGGNDPEEGRGQHCGGAWGRGRGRGGCPDGGQTWKGALLLAHHRHKQGDTVVGAGASHPPMACFLSETGNNRSSPQEERRGQGRGSRVKENVHWRTKEPGTCGAAGQR